MIKTNNPDTLGGARTGSVKFSTVTERKIRRKSFHLSELDKVVRDVTYYKSGYHDYRETFLPKVFHSSTLKCLTLLERTHTHTRIIQSDSKVMNFYIEV